MDDGMMCTVKYVMCGVCKYVCGCVHVYVCACVNVMCATYTSYRQTNDMCSKTSCGY